ncbi:hypothetical protein VE04_08734, partial [Pseudogymnoascus sp. 24MN13]
MWKRSGIEAHIRAAIQEEEGLYLYGDLAYRSAYGIRCPWAHPQGRHFLPEEKKAWNRALSS